MELLDRKVTKGKMEEGNFVEVETKTVREIIDETKDVWAVDQNTIISHVGVQKIAKFVGAIWKIPQVISEPNKENQFRDAMFVTCTFPDGSEHTELGEANIKTTKPGISQDYKLTMAHKRGMDRALLRSNYIGFFDVYSEEEAEVFKRKDIGKAQDSGIPSLAELASYVALPSENEKYPNELVKNVLRVHKDENYMKELVKNEDEVISYVAKGFLALWEKAKQEKRRKLASQSEAM